MQPMSKLFAFGLFLLISNFIVGKAALPVFAINFYLGLGIYLFSWIMLFTGLLICGKPGWQMAKTWYRQREDKLRYSFKNILK